MSLVSAVVVSVDVGGRSWGQAVDLYVAGALDCASTRRTYGWALKRAFAVMGVATLDAVTPYHLAAFRASIMRQRLAPSSKRQQLAALRSFLKWTRAFGMHSIAQDVIDVILRLPPNSTQVPYTILTEPEIVALMAVSPRPRDRAMLLVMLGAGLRVSEVSALDCGDLVQGEPPYLIVRNGKGGRSRAVPVRAQVMQALWALSIGHRSDAPLFRTRQGKPGRLLIPGLRCRLARLGQTAEIRRPVTPHMLRHTYATRGLKFGGNIMAISKLLGHRQLSTTQRYLDHLELPDLLVSVPPLPGDTAA